MPFPAGDTLLILPELFLTAAALVVLLWATFTSRQGERALAFFSVAALAATGLLLFVSARMAGALPKSGFGGMFVMDRFGLYFKAILILVTIVTILFRAASTTDCSFSRRSACSSWPPERTSRRSSWRSS